MRDFRLAGSTLRNAFRYASRPQTHAVQRGCLLASNYSTPLHSCPSFASPSLLRSVSLWRYYSQSSCSQAEQTSNSQQGQQHSTDTSDATPVSSDENTSATLVNELRAALEAAEAQIALNEEKFKELQDRLLRALAEGENARERHERALEAAKTYGITKFAEALLEVADNLDLALQHSDNNAKDLQAIVEGVNMTKTVLTSVMEKFGISSFDAMDQPFSPTLHEALFEVAVPNKPKGTVVQVVRKGYKIHQRVLRPAKVGTAK